MQRNPDGTFATGGPSANPAGVSRRVIEARRAIQDGLLPLAMRHARWVLTGEEPRDATPWERALYAGVTVRDRSDVMKTVVEYSIPKPKAAMRVEGKGADGAVTVVVQTLAEEKA